MSTSWAASPTFAPSAANISPLSRQAPDDHIDSVISDYSRFYCAAFLFDDVNKLLSGLWIRIRMDPHYLSLLDPDIGEKNVWKKLKNAMKLVIIGILLQFLH